MSRTFAKYLACALTMAAACGEQPSGDVTSAVTTTAINPNVVSSGAVLGFESTAGWIANSANVALSTSRTEGTHAVALTPFGAAATILSQSVAIDAAGLAGLSDPSAVFALDVAPPANADGVEVLVSEPKRGFTNVSLGRVALATVKPGLFTTVRFAIPQNLKPALGTSAATFGPLVLTVRVTTNGAPASPAAFVLDHLRVHSPGAKLSAQPTSVDLDAKLSYSPSRSTPAVANLPVGIVQVPARLHVAAGGSGQGSATLELGFGGAPTFSCRYAADSTGANYDIASCSGGAAAGDLVGADFARLTIVGGNPTAGATRVRAQLDVNTVGDRAGSGIVPPMPTYWGATPSETGQIVGAYFDAVNAQPKTEERWVQAPAARYGRVPLGPPTMAVTAPRPFAGVSDHPFDTGGHINEGGAFDAYWRLLGDLSADNSNNRNRAHFDIDLSAHAVALWQDVNVIKVHGTVDTDSGEVQSFGFTNPSATGSFHAYLFGVRLPGGSDNIDPHTGFDFTISSPPIEYDVLRMQYWIFSLSAGVSASASITTHGSLSFGNFDLGVAPAAVISGFCKGGVDIGIASGVVDATVDLLSVSTPVNATASWAFDTNPGPNDCRATLSSKLDGIGDISTLGGRVDLVATFGVCPFCFHASQNLVSWSPAAEWKTALFPTIPLFNVSFPLPPAVCLIPLNVNIQAPTAQQTIYAGQQVQVGGGATRVQNGNFKIVDCSTATATWSWSGASSGESSGVDNCQPLLRFAAPGSYTITLTITDQYGESGSAKQSFTVLPAPSAPQAIIVTPGSHMVSISNPPMPINFVGDATGGVGPYSWNWTVTWPDGSHHWVSSDASTTWSVPSWSSGDYTMELAVIDATGQTSSAWVVVTAQVLK